MYVVNNSQMKIKFKKEYYPLIREGIKTQTLRKPNSRLDVHVGDVVLAVFPGIYDVVKIKITMVGYKQFKSINGDDALLEGFDSIADLKNDLLKIYPELNDYNRLYYYRFEVVE